MKRLLLAVAALSLGFAAASAARAEDVLVGIAGPFTGSLANFGEQLKHGAEAAADDINATGGINGDKIVLEWADDACDRKQAIAVANALVGKGVKFVLGHVCSGSSIPASKVYEEEGVLMISAASTNPKLTDEGGWNVHRVCGRDDAQGAVAGAFLARKFAGKKVAILHDQSPYGKGLADETKKAMNGAGLTEAMYETIEAGEKDYKSIVEKLKGAAVDAVYLGGYHTEGGLILRQMREAGVSAQMVMGDTVNTLEFWDITGDAGEGMVFTFAPDPQKFDSAKAVVDKLKAAGKGTEGYTLYAYAAIQAWAIAAKATGGRDPRKIAEWLRAGNELDTVIGKLQLDRKGDVVDAKYVWHKWSKGAATETDNP